MALNLSPSPSSRDAPHLTTPLRRSLSSHVQNTHRSTRCWHNVTSQNVFFLSNRRLGSFHRSGSPGSKQPTYRVFRHNNSRIFSRKVQNNILSNKHVGIPLATLGPEEPHAASSTWVDEALDKKCQGIDEQEIEKNAFFNSELLSHPKLHEGRLGNGLRYFILPNKLPANRFEAHMEVHVGSVDEEDDEQGIAHMIEHVVFLGSKKREKLLGMGTRSNAYTDFHHTVFHVNSPSNTKDFDGDLLPVVLDALNEIVFNPSFLHSRVEKERKAILSELQMMNTIEYRVDCQLLVHLHSENKLSKRFPIGLEEQIKKWDSEKLKQFHKRWYFPANAYLYIVGDFDNIPNIEHEIEAVFGNIDSGKEIEEAPPNGAFGSLNGFLPPRISGVLSKSFLSGRKTSNFDVKKQEVNAVPRLIEHNWPNLALNSGNSVPQIFQHEFLQNFSIHMFMKDPVTKIQTYGELRGLIMKRIYLSALLFRINSRYKSSDPPFTLIEADNFDSSREGCTITSLTVTCEPLKWKDAIKAVVNEVCRLKEFGITKGELTRYLGAILKDSEQLAVMVDNVSSLDHLDFIMGSVALGHTVMDQKQRHDISVIVAQTITLEEVNCIGAEMLRFIYDYGKHSTPLPSAIVACVPKKVHCKGDVGEVELKISSEDVIDAIKDGLDESTLAEPEVEVPVDLIPLVKLQELKLQRIPSFVPVTSEFGNDKVWDEETGIVQRRLSNGIAVNYKISRHEAQGAVMRLTVGGGRAAEGPDAKGAVLVGVRTISEGGRVGSFSRSQVELFCMNHLINCTFESTEEFTCMEFHFTLRENGMRAAFQLLHMVLEHSVWQEDAFVRSKQLYLSFYHAIPKSLERSTARKLLAALLNGDERFLEPGPESLQSLKLQSVKEAIMNQFVCDNMEVNIVGDFTEEDVESCILDYLGTVRVKGATKTPDVLFSVSRPGPLTHQVFLKDTDERACAYIAGLAPNRWGFTVDGIDLSKSFATSSDGSIMKMNVFDGNLHSIRSHPLFLGVALSLLAEVMNSRLFTTVRDSLGLSYDVSFELRLFDRINLGWYVISVTSTREKIYEAVDASKNVLRGFRFDKITQRELDRAKRTVVNKHEAELKSNAYWLGLLSHLQAASVPKKGISCIKDLVWLIEAATVGDLHLAYKQLRTDEYSVFSSIGISGTSSPS